MLILSRRVGERLHIADEVYVDVLSVRGHQVRLGIDAPRSVEVHRVEVWQRIQAEQAEEPGKEQLAKENTLPLLRDGLATPIAPDGDLPRTFRTLRTHRNAE
jgi:carbon storage regulator